MTDFNLNTLIGDLGKNTNYVTRKASDPYYSIRVYFPTKTGKISRSSKNSGWTIVNKIIKDYGYDWQWFMNNVNFGVYDCFITL